ncbi:rabenosyn-5 [Brachyhypopomus gauderio]|uniref:rabenosyn-5 n=1 Tax=Brachyhypopomus gauderio TaxID=698409 RepID=UPI004042FB88
MASSYPPPLDGSAEVKEGFLCPLCLKDLQSFYQLQEHYEEEHAGDNRHVGAQLKSLVQKAKKAKDKLLKRDGDERTETSYESFYYGGVDPYMWEPQELGATRSHLDLFKKHRAARIDHYVIEVNKRIIRLEKLTSFDRINMDGGKIRALEKSVVPWVSDQDVPFCPDCGGKFNLRNRRHHCRLCGSIMCGKCMEFVPLVLAYKLTSGTREALCVAGSPGHGAPPGGGGLTVQQQAPRRGSISSLSSVSSVLEEKDEDRIRCCSHCMDALLRHQHKLEEKDHVPDIVKLYERLRTCMEKVDEKAPDYIRMAESLNAGETTYNLETAGSLRLEVQKYYEHIDALSKKILTLGLKDEVQPHPKSLQLQRMVRYSATLFVQEKLLGLMSLPTKEKYEELKEKRREEQERRLHQQRQAALEAQKRRSETDKNRPPVSANGDAPRPAAGPRMTKAGGWLPSSEGARSRGELDDPLLQQIDNIESFLRQARAAGRSDEVAMLEENLRQLQDEFDAQQTTRAIELSRRLAQEESLQRSQISYLQQRELESRAAAKERAADSGEGKSVEEAGEEGRSRDPDASPELRLPQTIKSFPRLPGTSPPSLRDEGAQNSGGSTPLNPFDEEDSLTGEEDPTNPFSEAIQRERQQAASAEDKEYNPFQDEENDAKEADTRQEGTLGGNPFEDDDRGNPFKGTPDETLTAASTNPFEGDDDGPAMDDIIEEELLLQQIDNIRAYIFDAKLNGRSDEVDLLSQNLKDLQRTLQEQKRKTH